MPIKGQRRPIIERFWDHVDTSSGPCFSWTGSKDKDGYGLVTLEGNNGPKTSIGAHKLAWMLVHGDTNNLYVLHTCDNPSCVNPDHLYLGTQFDNMRDLKLRTGNTFRFKHRTHCPSGHQYTPENTYIRTNRNSKYCRMCARIQQQAFRDRRAQCGI